MPIRVVFDFPVFLTHPWGNTRMAFPQSGLMTQTFTEKEEREGESKNLPSGWEGETLGRWFLQT